MARADTAKAEARYEQIQELLKSGRAGASVPDSLANPVITELREKFLTASKTEAQLESKLGSGHLQVINLRREMEEYQRLITEELQRIADSYRSDAEVARQKEQSLSLSMSGLVGANAGTNETMVQLRELERESETYKNLYQTFMQRYQEAIQQQSFPVSEARVITAATPPANASYPKRSLILALSLVMGGMAGAGFGALREHRDRVFRTAANVRDELGLEFLGMLQDVDAPATAKSAKGEVQDPKQIHVANALQRYSIDHPLSSFAETLRSAKVAVDLALGDRRPKVVGIISALPNEGKSTVAKNFASLLAHLGARAALIDGDLRNPGLSRDPCASGRRRGSRGDSPRAAVGRLVAVGAGFRPLRSSRRDQEAGAAFERTAGLARHARGRRRARQSLRLHRHRRAAAGAGGRRSRRRVAV